MSPREQATNFLDHDVRLVAAFESLTPERRMTAQVDLGFLPEPLPLASFAGMRLNEVGPALLGRQGRVRPVRRDPGGRRGGAGRAPGGRPELPGRLHR